MGKDLTDEVGEPVSLADAIDSVSPGIEVHNYRFRFGGPTSQELVASNGLHACLVVGDRKTGPEDLDLDLEGVGLFVNGVLADSGIGAEVMGGPLVSLRWLVNHLVRRGEVLRAGQLVIPGSAVGLTRSGRGTGFRPASPTWAGSRPCSVARMPGASRPPGGVARTGSQLLASAVHAHTRPVRSRLPYADRMSPVFGVPAARTAEVGSPPAREVTPDSRASSTNDARRQPRPPDRR